jgi:hypothetical protein
MNLKAIADAIALRFVGITATRNGVVESLVSPPTASLPNTIAKGPVIIVFPPTAALEIGVNRMRNDHYLFPVRLFRDPTDFPTRTEWLYAWHDAMRDRIEGNVDLDLPYVARAQTVSIPQMEMDVIDAYADGKFDVLVFSVSVLVREVVTTVSP